MINEIYDEIKCWAGVSTWHTAHPLDTQRFYKAVNNVARNIGTNISESDFKAALKRHVPSSAFDDQVDSYTEMAITIFEYLDHYGNA